MFKDKRKETEQENEGLDEYCYCLTEKDTFDLSYDDGNLFRLHGTSPPKKVRVCETGNGLDHKTDPKPSEDGGAITSVGEEPQDADYSYLPSLDYEVENLIFARLPRSEHWKLCFVNKRCLTLLTSGEIFKIRREIGFKEPSVFMLASGETSWWAFDRDFKSRMRLPFVPSDPCFHSGDKESLCAGTHLLVSGREIDGIVIWRYELATNQWFKGPSMISPRCLFASTTCGTSAFVAGGVGAGANSEVYDTAEKYNPETGFWDPLPRMKRRRKLCSGCFMDNRFYVIGGRNENGELTCGEYFDESKNRWELIPDMFKDDPVRTCHSPPLVAVVNNELYSLEASSNQLKVYLKKTNTWKHLGPVPVRADFNRGWGVAFKSLGDELLVIGASSYSCAGNCMSIYTCCPDPEASEQPWKPLDGGRNRLSHFILNCSIMVA
ncbi:F-box/kelch-repeat protein At3g27150 isoform X1 [Coffea eugenioides]|uniref:F-box/kelch-repeat protein At3g27150 isoform X1 n=1 Tax=Coffea eugenioides TaxID=49369 RepID=UPI000F60E194|nr:F-box/kelch-repeat protein At3g27150 isoform X1 [Coffea eugenioides]